MGMAASQARLLTITARLSDNELRSQMINNAKMRLAADSARASDEYVDALNDAQLMFTNVGLDGITQSQQLTFNSLTAYSPYNTQYGLRNPAGLALVSEGEAGLFIKADGDLNEYLKLHNLEWETTYFKQGIIADDLINSYGDDYKFLFKDLTNDDYKVLYEKYQQSEELSIEQQEYDNYARDYYNKLNMLYKTVQPVFTQKVLDNKKYDDRVQEVAAYENAASIVGALAGHGVGEYLTEKGKEFTGKMAQSSVSQEGGYWGYTNTIGSPLVSTQNSDGTFTCTVDDLTITYDSSGNVQDIVKKEGSNVQYDGSKSTLVELIKTITNDTGSSYNFYDCVQNSDGGYTVYDNIFNQKTADDAWEKFTEEVINGLTTTIEYLDYEKFAEDNSSGSDELGKYITARDHYLDMYDLHEFKEMIMADPTLLLNFEKLLLEIAKDGTNGIAGLESLESKGNSKFANVVDVLRMKLMINVLGEPKYTWTDSEDIEANTKNADAKAQWYTNLFNRMKQGYKALEDGLASSPEWIEYAFENGIISLEQVDLSFNWNTMSYKNCAKITTETLSEAKVALAEAKYNRAMNDIQHKDQMYDLDLKNIDTEHTALQTEYDVLKGVISKNIERNFKFDQSA